MRATRPLFRFDSGWLFIIAGLAVCAAGVLLPAQADLRALEDQLRLLQDEEARAYQRLAAHAEFIDQIDRHEPAIIKRLAATQLNLVPEGDKPVLLAAGETAPVTEWIDNTVVTDIRPGHVEPASTLSAWAIGPKRLWLFGGGIMAVFIGLLISPEPARRRSQRPAQSTAISNHAVSLRAPSDLRMDDCVNGDDGAFDAMFAADAEEQGRIDAMLRSLPATIDLEQPGELSQQEDTIDLEEDELPARSRNVIDDDASWHAAAAVEHASEVIIEAKEVARSAEQSLLWEGAVDSATPGTSADDARFCEDDEEQEKEDDDPTSSASTIADASTDDDDWSEADDRRMEATAMLLPEIDDVDEESESTPGATESPEHSPTAADATPVDGARAVDRPKSRSRRRVAPKNTRSTRDDETTSDEAPVRRKPASGAKRRIKPANDDATAIPFLRYRPHDEEDDDGSAAEDDEALTMLDDDDSSEGQTSADDADGDDVESGDDETSMKFRSD